MGLLKEFKEFALKGNVLDLAIGVIIGGAFGKIVSSLVEDVITPLIFNNVMKDLNISKIEDLVAGNGIAYGKFLSAIISFICVAFVLFLIIKAANKINKKPAEAPAEPSATEVLLTEIRDELRRK